MQVQAKVTNLNLDTLLKAAKFLERQEEGPRDELRTETRTAVSTEEPADLSIEVRIFQHQVWAKGIRSESVCRESNTEDVLKDLRRRPGASRPTREVHNNLEKNRRANLNVCFELVKKQMPPGYDDNKASKLNILHNAIKYIQTLRRKDRENENEMERLAKQKIALQQRFATLKKEFSARRGHIDIPDTEHDEVMATSDSDELLHSSASSLESSATASPHLPDMRQERIDRHSPRSHLSPKHIPSDGPKLISLTSSVESAKRPLAAPNINKSTQAPLQLPVLTSSAGGQIAAALVSPTIQLVTSSNIRMLPGDQPLTLSQPISLSVQPGLRAKNGAIYKQSSLLAHLASSIPHAVTPLVGHHVTLGTPVPVTVVSQGNQGAHLLTAPQGKMVTLLSIKPLISHCTKKPGAAMVVVSQSSQVSQSTGK